MPKILDYYQQKGQIPAKWYPNVLGPDFRSVWKNYLTTKTCRSILELCKTQESKKLYLAQTFISYLQASGLTNVDGKFYTAIKTLQPKLEQASHYLATELHKMGLSDTRLKVVKSECFTRPLANYNMINTYHGLELEGTIVYNTRYKADLTQILHSFTGYMYKEVPVLLQPNKRKIKQVMASEKAMWYTVKHRKTPDVSIKVARADKQLLIRYNVLLPCLVPYGKDKSSIDKKLAKLWPKLFKLQL